MPDSTPPALGRPRADLNATVFAATLRTVHELGYANATMDRIAAAAGVAKTTIYRRWPSKGALIADCLLDAFGPLGPIPGPRDEAVATLMRRVAATIGEPGVGLAFAAVFVDAMSDPALREVLATRLQEPGRLALKDTLGVSDSRVELIFDVVAGTLLHRMGMTGRPMAADDLDALTEMVLCLLRRSRSDDDRADGVGRRAGTGPATP